MHGACRLREGRCTTLNYFRHKTVAYFVTFLLLGEYSINPLGHCAYLTENLPEDLVKGADHRLHNLFSAGDQQLKYHRWSQDDLSVLISAINLAESAPQMYN